MIREDNMKIQGINPNSIEFNKIKTGSLNNNIGGPGVASFENVYNKLVTGVNTDQLDADKATTAFLNGEDIELHEVMIAAEKAKTSLDLLVEIRNKTLDMYKELTRIQI